MINMKEKNSPLAESDTIASRKRMTFVDAIFVFFWVQYSSNTFNSQNSLLFSDQTFVVLFYKFHDERIFVSKKKSEKKKKVFDNFLFPVRRRPILLRFGSA